MNIEISTNADEAIRALDNAEQAITPREGGGDAVRRIIEIAQAYASLITHRQTGTLSLAHHIDDSRLRSEGVAIVSLADRVNPISKALTSAYGPIEHARGGHHAFYTRTENERGSYALEQGAQLLGRKVVQAWR